jgi:ABC-type Co2+ transport system permease subunit
MGGITSLGANVVTMGIVMSFSTYYFYRFTAELDDRLSIFFRDLHGDNNGHYSPSCNTAYCGCSHP